MLFIPFQPYHVYNRGINRQPVFYTHENYLFFTDKLKNHIRRHADIIAYCLMPNHFHLLLYPHFTSVKNALNNEIGIVLRSYTQALNKQQTRTGSLFQQKTKSKNLYINNINYAETCFQYIHQNPVKNKLVKDPADWPYSSFNAYAGLESGGLINKELAYTLFDIPKTSNEFIHYSKSMTLDF